MSLREAVAVALEANPQIGEAIANRQAIEFELRQGRGLYLPRVDLEGDLGAQRRDNATTHANKDNKHTFFRKQGTVIIQQLLFDGFKSDAEVERQASRVDAAAHRVLERSEFIALSVIRQYLEIELRYKILVLAQRNVAFHAKIARDIRTGARSGSISVADRQQANERVHAARARVAVAREELNAGLIRFNRLVGKPSGPVVRSPSYARHLPRSLSMALGVARKNNPRIRIQNADLDTAYALLKAARAKFYPKLTLEGRARGGHDLDGIRGHDHDLRAGVVMRWNLYSGGIDTADVQEQIRRIDEQRKKLHRIHRAVEEAVRLSWDRLVQQRLRARSLSLQFGETNRLIGSYRAQFGVGKRSLLDLLDTQNTRFGANVALQTSLIARKFAEYRILAATGTLLKTLRLKAPKPSNAYARRQAGVPPTPDAEKMPRHSPVRPVDEGEMKRHAPSR
jgi:adhesin transport system outer membrane protein